MTMPHIPSSKCVDTCNNPMECGEDYQKFLDAAPQLFEAGMEAVGIFALMNDANILPVYAYAPWHKLAVAIRKALNEEGES